MVGRLYTWQMLCLCAQTHSLFGALLGTSAFTLSVPRHPPPSCHSHTPRACFAPVNVLLSTASLHLSIKDFSVGGEMYALSAKAGKSEAVLTSVSAAHVAPLQIRALKQFFPFGWSTRCSLCICHHGHFYTHHSYHGRLWLFLCTLVHWSFGTSDEF